MDNKNIGKFIAECRRNKGLTQEQLAEKMFVTDRAVSKWERGLSLPDVGIMLSLCEELDISLNELFMGERIMNEDYEKKTESLLLELAKQDELKNKKIMASMWTLLITSSIFYVSILILAISTLEEGVLLGTIICLSTIMFLIAGFIALKLETDAGYYECKHCHHKFVPSYRKVLFAIHMGTSRYLKCPECKKRSLTKKVLSK